MPSLVAFDRKWNIASDDFVFPELTEAFVRLFWIAFGIFVFIFHFPLSCSAKDVTVSLLGLLFINGLTVALAFLIVAISSRGTIMDSRPRKHVATLLYIRLPIFILEIVWNIYSTVQAFESVGDDTSCHFSTIIKVTVSLEWVLILCVLLGVLIVFNPVSEDSIEDGSLLARRTWSRRFRIFKIRQDVMMRAALDDLANLVASFFQTGDVVLSDVAAGLLLVVHSPTNEYPPIVPVAADGPFWMTERNALHFLHFSSCVYGWPTYILHNCGIRPVAKLFRKLQCCGGLRCDQVHVIEDNCCFCNTAAFVLSTEQRNIDLFFVSFRNRLYQVPFVVLADHDSKSVVITIRGSCSLSDLVTDLCLDDEILSVDVDSDPVLREDTTLDGRGHVRVHRGMLQSARYVFDAIRKHHLLEDLFVLNPSYQLVVCGHSLGAGVASLLTLLLKQSYPQVRCFAFAPPGCVISEEGQPEMEQHVMSIVGGDDVVSRISYQSLHRLRAKVDAELNSCVKAKYEILIRGVFRLFFKAPWDDAPLSGTVAQTDRAQLIRQPSLSCSYGAADASLPQLEAQPVVGDAQLVANASSRIQLYAPGKILYVAKENEGVIKEWIDYNLMARNLFHLGEEGRLLLHFVGGKNVALSNGSTFPVFEPRSGRVLSECQNALEKDVQDTVERAAASQPNWGASTWMQRGDVLRRTAQLLGENCEELARWESIDNGKPLYEARMDVMSCVDTFNYFAGIGQSLAGQHFPLCDSTFAYTTREPLGVIGCVGAWNYPIQTCTWKTAPALACGNSVVYKPSPLAPISAVLLGKILQEAGLPDGVFNVIQGGGETGKWLVEHPSVKKVSFTGSIATGKKIMQSCASRKVKPLTLELGGKSALIIFEDSDVENAVAGAMMANFFSQGQVCSNASKVLVHRSVLSEFTSQLVSRTKAMKIDDPLKEDTRVGAHISTEQRDRVKQYIKGAISEGATVLCGGEEVTVAGFEGGYYLSPCVLTDIKEDMTVYKEEIFGSVLMIIPFDSEEEAVSKANDTDMGLAAGLFTSDLSRAHRVASRLQAGNVFVNTFNDVSPFVPFGGYNQSGFGRENGAAVVEHYTQIKSVFVNTAKKLENPF